MTGINVACKKISIVLWALCFLSIQRLSTLPRESAHLQDLKQSGASCDYFRIAGYSAIDPAMMTGALFAA